MAFKQITRDEEFSGAFPVAALRSDAAEEFIVPTKEQGSAIVTLLSDESAEQAELHERHGGDYMDGVPSIRVMLGGSVHYLTWEEAYNLGHSLKAVAAVAYFG